MDFRCASTATRSLISAATAKTCGRAATSARRAPRWPICTPTPIDCANRWCGHPAVMSRCHGTTRTPKSNGCCDRCSTATAPPPSPSMWATRSRITSGLSTHIGALIGMAQAAGMPSYYSPGTVDQWPLNLVSALLFGHMWNAPIPDVDRTDHLMIFGANPAASQGSMLSAPDLMGRLAAIRRRGGNCHRRRSAPNAHRATRVAMGADPARHRRAAAVRDPAHTRREQLGASTRPSRRARHRTRRCDRDGRRLRAGNRRRRVRYRRDDHPATRARSRARRSSGAVQPHRRMHTRVRHVGHLAGVRRQHRARCAGPGWRRGVPQAGRLVADVHEAAGPGRCGLAVRPLPQPGARRAGGVQPVSGQLSRPRRSTHPATVSCAG